MLPVTIYAEDEFKDVTMLTDHVDIEAKNEVLERVNEYALTMYQSDYFDDEIDPNADYDNTGGKQRLQYFDGAENEFKTASYLGSSTEIASFGTKYYWNRSILIPLY